MQYLDGSCYAGAWRAGERQGQGRQRTPEGDVFIGGFSGGRRSGPGALLMVRCLGMRRLWQDRAVLSVRLCLVTTRQAHVHISAV